MRTNKKQQLLATAMDPLWILWNPMGYKDSPMIP